MLGSRWVADRADDRLRDAAKSALARIAAVLPPALREDLDSAALLIGPGAATPSDAVDPALLRKAIRTERKLSLDYRDGTGAASTRIVWPFALAFFESVRVLLAWCEMRKGFRHFRTDRIVSATLIETRYAKRRPMLLREWREAEGIGKDLD